MNHNTVSVSRSPDKPGAIHSSLNKKTVHSRPEERLLPQVEKPQGERRANDVPEAPGGQWMTFRSHNMGRLISAESSPAKAVPLGLSLNGGVDTTDQIIQQGPKPSSELRQSSSIGPGTI